MAKEPKSMKKQKMITDIVVHVFLVIVSIIWLIPFIWIIAHSFRGESTGMYCSTFFPKEYTLDNYIGLLTDVLKNKESYLGNIISAQVPSTEYGYDKYVDGVYHFGFDLELAKEDLYEYIYEK